MLNRILEPIRTPPQDIIGLSEFLRQFQTLRPTSKPTSEVVKEKNKKMATQSDLVVRNRKLPNRSFLYLPYIFPETPEEVEHNGPGEKN